MQLAISYKQGTTHSLPSPFKGDTKIEFSFRFETMLNVKDHKKLGLANTKNKIEIIWSKKKTIHKQGKPNEGKNTARLQKGMKMN